MKKIILYAMILALSISCSRVGPEEIVVQPPSITQIRAHVGTNKTRVVLDVNPDIADSAFWKQGDFLYVIEKTESQNLFTGHILKYRYVPSMSSDREVNGTFNGFGMVTGGKYLVVNTNIPYSSLKVPQLGDNFFECTYKKTYVCTASFGESLAEVQELADELLFVGSTTISDSNTDISIPLTSPMSMIELRLTAKKPVDDVERITIESSHAVFSYKIYINQSGDCQSANMLDNYQWEPLNSEVIYTAGHAQSLNDTTPLKVRIVAFQKIGETTSLTIKAYSESGATLSYTTSSQTQTLTPNAVTVINARFD